MSREMKHPFLAALFGVGAVTSLTVAALVGCNNSSGPVTKESTKFEAADEPTGGTTQQADSDSPSGRATNPLGRTNATGSSSPGKTAANSASGRNSSGSNHLADTSNGAAPQKPPTIPSDELNDFPVTQRDGYPVPDGSPQQLLDFIADLEQRQPQGRTAQEMLVDFQKLHQARIVAAEKILAAPTEDKYRVAAAEAKLIALGALAERGIPGAGEHIREFCDALQDEKNSNLARLGRLVMFSMEVSDLASGRTEETKPVLDGLKSLLAGDDREPPLFKVAQQAIIVLYSTGNQSEAIDAMRIVGQAYQNSPDESEASEAQDLLQQAQITELGFAEKLNDAMVDKPNAIVSLLDVVRKLLGGPNPGSSVLAATAEAAQYLEITQHYQEASAIYQMIGDAYKNHADGNLVQRAQTSVENGQRRMGLIGKPFQVAGVTLDGKPLDWNNYKGKVVLVDFWATWCVPCLQEIPNIKTSYRLYHDRGFEVIGVNLDEDPAAVEQFFEVQQLPWTTVRSADPDAQGFANPLAIECGIDAIPFIVLIGRDGKVAALHVRGPMLEEKLAEIFGAAESAAGASKNKVGSTPLAPPHDQTDANRRNDFSLKTPNKVADASAFVSPYEPTTTYLVSSNEPVANTNAAGQPIDDSTEAGAAVNSDVNPYSAPAGLSPAELVDFIFDMQEKPKSIQARPGFAEAIVEAADQILQAETQDKFQIIAAESKVDVLHKKASLGDQQADRELMQFAAQMKDDRRERIAKQVQFLLLERKAIDVEQVPIDTVPELLDELKQFFAREKLTARHLRLASRTIAAVNRLDDSQAREQYFTEFGNLFAASSDKELARYGQKLVKTPSQRIRQK